MTQVLLLTLVLLIPATSPDTFDVQAELQGLYDEISQATLQFVTESDVDVFHDVLYTSDWVFVDATGRRETWIPTVRERAVQALSAPRLDSMIQPIQKLSLTPDGATVVVNMTTVRTSLTTRDATGEQDRSRTVTETTAFRDSWVHVSDRWKLKSREQIGGPTVSVGRSNRST